MQLVENAEVQMLTEPKISMGTYTHATWAIRLSAREIVNRLDGETIKRLAKASQEYQTAKRMLNEVKYKVTNDVADALKGVQI